MSKTLVVRVKVRIDVNLDAYEREYGEVVGSGRGADITESDIRTDLKTMAEGVLYNHLIPLSNVYKIVSEA